MITKLGRTALYCCSAITVSKLFLGDRKVAKFWGCFGSPVHDAYLGRTSVFRWWYPVPLEWLDVDVDVVWIRSSTPSSELMKSRSCGMEVQTESSQSPRPRTTWNKEGWMMAQAVDQVEY